MSDSVAASDHLPLFRGLSDPVRRALIALPPDVQQAAHTQLRACMRDRLITGLTSGRWNGGLNDMSYFATHDDAILLASPGVQEALRSWGTVPYGQARRGPGLAEFIGGPRAMTDVR
jgi:hypothetical protein